MKCSALALVTLMGVFKSPAMSSTSTEAKILTMAALTEDVHLVGALCIVTCNHITTSAQTTTNDKNARKLFQSKSAITVPDVIFIEGDTQNLKDNAWHMIESNAYFFHRPKDVVPYLKKIDYQYLVDTFNLYGKIGLSLLIPKAGCKGLNLVKAYNESREKSEEFEPLSRQRRDNDVATPRRKSVIPYKKNYDRTNTPPPDNFPENQPHFPPVRPTTPDPKERYKFAQWVYDARCEPVCDVDGRTFPSLTDCNKYYVCVHGRPALFTCALGTSYDTDISHCQHKATAYNNLCNEAIECMVS